MQLGFVSAILPEQSLEEVMRIAAEIGYDCVELMCWPQGKAERRYAGVTHVDVTDFDESQAEKVLALSEEYGVAISGLGYYPNPLVADREEGQVYIDHIKKVIAAAALLGVNQMNTFVGRDHRKSVADNWPRFLEVWPDIIRYAEEQGVRVGIENCPMIFTDDEWPGGKNLATTPNIWRKMYAAIDSDHFGLNYDPSHLIWQHMDYLAPMRDFSHKLFHVHAKDVRVDQHKLDQVGIMAPPNQWHEPKLPGLGAVDWGQFFSILSSAGYKGPVCVEVEDRAYEGSLERRIAALRQSYTYLRQFMA
ncbi:MAG: sugar phosphate isomerase/epimerase family protein [Bacteroidota bacterium]